MAKNLFLAISRVLCEWSPVSQECSRHSWAVILASFFFTRSLRMKSLPSSLTFLNASSSNDQSQLLTFLRVSMSELPAKGDNPESSTYARTPMAHMSVKKPTASLSTISGAANSAVPVEIFTNSLGSSLVASPKSMILTWVLLLVVHITFSGLMSAHKVGRY